VGRDRTGHLTRKGEGLGTTQQSPIKRGKVLSDKQEGEWWQKSQSPERFEDEYNELEAAFIEKPTPGDIKPQGPPSWAGLSSFPLPLVLLSPVDALSGFMFPSGGMFDLPLLSGGHDVPYSTHRWSLEGNNDSPFLPIMFKTASG
jgi:hypothetical protein